MFDTLAFRNLNFKVQLIIGVYSISICVYLMLFSLILVNVFVSLVFFYTRQLQIVYDFEREELDGASRFVDSTVSESVLTNFYYADMINETINFTFQDAEKQDLIQKIEPNKIVTSINPHCTENSPCILIYSSNSKNVTIMKVLQYSYPMFEQFYHSTGNNITILLEEFELYLYFPYTNGKNTVIQTSKQTIDLLDWTKERQIQQKDSSTYGLQFRGASNTANIYSKYYIETNIFKETVSFIEEGGFREFGDLKFLLVNPDLSVINPKTCSYFQYLEDIGSTEIKDYVSCFSEDSFQIMKNEFSNISAMNVGTFIDTMNSTFLGSVDYIVQLVELPAFSNSIFTNTNMKYDFPYKLLLFKPSAGFEEMKRYFFYKYFSITFEISLSNLSVIYFLVSVVIYFVIRLSNKLTHPFSYLIEEMSKLGKEHVDYEGLENLRFREDEDIDKLFVICKEQIKKGFLREGLAETQLDAVKKYKGNFKVLGPNILVNEEKMNLEFQQQVKNLFGLPKNTLETAVNVNTSSSSYKKSKAEEKETLLREYIRKRFAVDPKVAEIGAQMLRLND